jgi:3-oxoacyl-[acyl-carrier protein] reductase
MVDAPITLVTGSRKGIGRHLAEHYLALGHRVIGCSRGGAGWEHARYQHHEIDITIESDVKKMFAAIRKEHGVVTNLINNAGIASMNHSLLTPAATVQKVMETNLLGSFLMAREAAKLMRRDRYGRIVNFSTVAVRFDLEGEAAYVASKAAVEALSRVLAREFAEFGITVNTVAPVPIKTDLIAGVPRDKIEALVQRQAIKRFGELADVSNVVDFYLRRESGFVTGQCIYLGGV